MLKYMLDTDISIYTMKRKPLEVKRMFNIHLGGICISTVTLGELIYGSENSAIPVRNLEIVEGFTGRMQVLDFDKSAARQFGQLKKELKGQPIGAYDLMIAAHARSLGLVLVSNNDREFDRVPGLRKENWVNT